MGQSKSIEVAVCQYWERTEVFLFTVLGVFKNLIYSHLNICEKQQENIHPFQNRKLCICCQILKNNVFGENYSAWDWNTKRGRQKVLRQTNILLVWSFHGLGWYWNLSELQWLISLINLSTIELTDNYFDNWITGLRNIWGKTIE